MVLYYSFVLNLLGKNVDIFLLRLVENPNIPFSNTLSGFFPCSYWSQGMLFLLPLMKCEKTVLPFDKNCVKRRYLYHTFLRWLLFGWKCKKTVLPLWIAGLLLDWWCFWKERMGTIIAAGVITWAVCLRPDGTATTNDITTCIFQVHILPKFILFFFFFFLPHEFIVDMSKISRYDMFLVCFSLCKSKFFIYIIQNRSKWWRPNKSVWCA